MDLPDQLQALDRETLVGPIRRMLHSDTADVLDWEGCQLGGGAGNPVSLGLYRIAGRGRHRGQVLTWSLVLKIAQSPANVGVANMGEGDDPAHWNYWKREMYLYRSGLLDRLPEGLAAPRCFGVEERPGDTIWLWLEEVEDRYSGAWPLERFGLAARHFGRFSGAYLQDRRARAFPWLSVGLLRQWNADLSTWAPLFAEYHPRSCAWDHPLVRQFYPPPDSNPFLHVMENRERFLEALNRLPQTLCHKDAYPTNLMVRLRRDGVEETVAVDWAMAGWGPLGEELAQLALGALDRSEGAELSEIDRVVFGGYLDGLRDSGWRGDARLVRFGYVASAVFRLGLIPLWMLSEVFEHSEPGASDAARRVEGQDSLQTVVAGLEKVVRLVLNLAEEACERLDTVL